MIIIATVMMIMKTDMNLQNTTMSYFFSFFASVTTMALITASTANSATILSSFKGWLTLHISFSRLALIDEFVKLIYQGPALVKKEKPPVELGGSDERVVNQNGAVCSHFLQYMYSN